jgi:hypothetical protein
MTGRMSRSMKNELAAAEGGHADGRARGDALGPNSEIGRKLRQLYEDVVSEEVPDRFTELLRKLEQSEKPASSRDGE